MSTLLECISLRVHQYTYSRSDNSKIINSHDCDSYTFHGFIFDYFDNDSEFQEWILKEETRCSSGPFLS